MHNCDHRVNLDLIKWGIGEPIPGIYADPQFGDLSAEQIYAKRQNDAPPAPQPEPQPDEDEEDDNPETDDEQDDNPDDNSDDDSPEENESQTDSEDDSDDSDTDDPGDQDGSGDGQDAPGTTDSPMPDCPTGDFVDADETPQGVDANGDPAPPPMTPEDWAIVSQIAAVAAQAAGDMGEGMVRALAKAREPEHDWVQELRQYVIQLLPSGRSWARPNRRFMGDGVYLPGPTKDTVGPVVFLIDSSCSVTQRMFDGFAAHVIKVMQEVQPERIYVVAIDTEVRSVAVFERDEEIKLELKGSGGTRFQPGLDWASLNEIEPMVAIYLTDLENYDNPLTEPPYPVLWATPNWITRVPQFGDVVRVDVER